MASERLQKIIAAAGIASRRKAEEIIVQGRVSVNGTIVSTLGAKADPENDHIKVDGQALRMPERFVYLMLHKPKGYVSTVSDPEGRPTVMELVRSKARIFPVGRLDWNTEGLLLMTNDGDLTAKLTHASTHVPKTYLVKVAGEPTGEQIQKLRDGVMIGGEGDPVPGKLHRVKTAPAKIREVREGDNPWYEVTLIEGRNRQIRRMFEAIDHHVEKIKRIRYGPLELDVPPGITRELRPFEVEKLKSYVSEPATAARENAGVGASTGAGAPLPRAAGLPPQKRFGKPTFGKSQNFRFRSGDREVRDGFSKAPGARDRSGNTRGERGPRADRPFSAGRAERPTRAFGGGGKPFRKEGGRPGPFIRADYVENEGRPGGVKRFDADGAVAPFEPRPSSKKPFGKPGGKRFGKPFGKPFEKREERGAAGPTKRFSRPPRGESAGGGARGDRPPRREFGGGAGGDRPPRREFGGAKRFGAKPFGGPRREAGGGKPFGGPRGEGGAGRPFAGPRGEGGPKRFGAKPFGGPRREGAGGKSFGGPRGESGPKRFGAKPFGGPRREGGGPREGAAGKSFGGPSREGAAGKPFGAPRREGGKSFGTKRPFGAGKKAFGGPKEFGAKKPFGARPFGSKPSGGPKRFGAKKPFAARSAGGPKRGFGGGFSRGTKGRRPEEDKG